VACLQPKELPNPGLRPERATAWPFPTGEGPSYTTDLPAASPAVWQVTWANPYLVVRRAASAHDLSFPYAEKDFVHPALAYSQPCGLASNGGRFIFSLDRS
jgi:hypothetical protein